MKAAVTHPAYMIAFDCLESKSAGDLRRRPLRVRRRELERLLARVPPDSHLALGMQTTDEDVAMSWYQDWPLSPASTGWSSSSVPAALRRG
ncbi:hypothetical protein ABN028_05940 [Actinopolymorpha sp. B17G11]|uniref:hypothetical protein n=1 Tax=Actinopolymorpha sp. B17G11 TaxID=3160861 RepID=UPI0032E4FA67